MDRGKIAPLSKGRERAMEGEGIKEAFKVIRERRMVGGREGGRNEAPSNVQMSFREQKPSLLNMFYFIHCYLIVLKTILFIHFI